MIKYNNILIIVMFISLCNKIDMYSNIPSVSRAIRDILFSNSIYINSLKAGIANYTALAMKIKPEVEKIVASQVNINTIVVSIKRIADTIQQQQSEQDLKISQDERESITGARISLTGGILDVEFDKEMENLEKIFAHEKLRLSAPKTSFRGLQKFFKFLRDFRALNSLKYFI